MQDIVTTLSRINHWWSRGEVDSAFLYTTIRDEYIDIELSLESRRITSVVGPRRVGKSTLLFQTIDMLLKRGISATNILFFSGDDPALFSENNSLDTVIEVFESEVLQKKFTDIESKVYIFIDEVHWAKEWQLWLKSYYDRKYNIKFVVSGSSSTHLFQGSKESLMGRIENIHVLPLLFDQFVKFFSVINKDEAILSLFKMLPEASFFENPIEYTREIIDLKWKIEDYRIPINKALKEYLLVGGYPEYFDNSNLLAWQKRLTEDIISRGLYRDIISIYSIKNPEVLEKLLYFVADNNGQTFSYTAIAKNLSVDHSTISSYINYLQTAFIISVQDNYSTNAGKIIRKNKKLYVTDNGIRNALLKLNNISSTEAGQLIESSAIQSARDYAEKNLFSIYYWRDNKKEVDIVIDKRVSQLPIEVKYRGNIKDSDIQGLRLFLKKFGAKEGAVITKDYLDIIDSIAFIPFWLIK